MILFILIIGITYKHTYTCERKDTQRLTFFNKQSTYTKEDIEINL